MNLARSWPCFEFWLVLHFTYHRRFYSSSGGRTAAQNCVKELREYIPRYEKGIEGVFLMLEEHLDSAKSNAERARLDAQMTGREDPSTELHLLVSYLQYLKES